MDIKKASEEAKEVAESKGFGDTPADFVHATMLVVTELSEAVEHYRNGHGMTEVWYEADGKPDGIPVELADAMIRIMHIAEYYGMDLGREVKEKLAYNRTRDFRHGNKEA